MLLAQCAVVCGNAVAVVRVSARLDLVDEITDGECVELARAEHERFLLLVDLLHEDFNRLFPPLAGRVGRRCSALVGLDGFR